MITLIVSLADYVLVLLVGAWLIRNDTMATMVERAGG